MKEKTLQRFDPFSKCDPTSSRKFNVQPAWIVLPTLTGRIFLSRNPRKSIHPQLPEFILFLFSNFLMVRFLLLKEIMDKGG